MASPLPEGEMRITPYILYEDVAAALDWLAAAFGFRERLRLTGDDGVVTHAEMTVLDDGVVMLGHPGPDYENPKKTGMVNQFPYIIVDDVDAHFAQAQAADASIVRELRDEEYGHRVYAAEDPEGHHWWFAQPVREVASEDWGAVRS
jgi:uncharacterized glyoxalase superfamily protein PhnB